MPVRRPTVLIPDVAEPEKWAVIACDQFTGQPEYWNALREQIGDAPSTLDLILPEAFLHDRLADAPAQIAAATERILAEVAFREVEGYVLVERTTSSGTVRVGLLADIELDAYDFSDRTPALIKATEATVRDRLPARIAIREAGPLETSHVMVLLDDPSRSLIEGLYAGRDAFEQLYDVELAMGGGHLRGWLVDRDVSADLQALQRDGVLFVVGDGNHSLAAAKLCGDTHALVELVNIHSDAMQFEPIHRVVAGAGQDLVEALVSGLTGDGSCSVYFGGRWVDVAVAANPADAIADIQQLLDAYLAEHDSATVDFIHGDEHTRAVADRDHSVAVFMPTIQKDSLFDYAARRGVLPRKAFSIGHAEDKRYYFELTRRSRPDVDPHP